MKELGSVLGQQFLRVTETAPGKLAEKPVTLPAKLTAPPSGHFKIYTALLVSKSCQTLRDRMDRSMSGFPVPHCPLEFTQTHVP